MAVEWEMLDAVDGVEQTVARQWDALAVRLGRPYCAPAWILASHHVAPASARIRIVVVRDGDEILGVAPFYAWPWRLGMWTWALMGTSVSSRIEPLCDPDRLGPAAAAIRAALAESELPPAQIRLDGVPVDSPWPMLLAAAEDGRRPAWSHIRSRVPAPTVALDVGSFDDYLSRRKAKFRALMRRARRKVERDGGEFRVATTPQELEPAIRELIRLHRARWDHRGGSSAVLEKGDRMLLAAGRELGPERFQLLTLVIGGKTISAQLFVAAGTVISYWVGGFDADYADYEPSQVAVVEAIRTSIERGYTRLDLGPGGQRYKYRLADSEATLVWMTLIPHRRQYASARLALAPEQARNAIAGRMTPEQKARVRKLMPRRRRRGTPLR
jgi:CelD/BcsL family acetyltransferase involved in cellulose biosynthesis